MTEIIENPPIIPTSQHPVLTALNEKIANLEDTVAVNEKTLAEQRNRAWEIMNNFNNYKYKLENVLRTYAQDNPDSAHLFVEIANEMGIELTNTKDYEVNVTFSITVTAPFGEEIELTDWDVDASLGMPRYDFDVSSTDVIYISES